MQLTDTNRSRACSLKKREERIIYVPLKEILLSMLCFERFYAVVNLLEADLTKYTMGDKPVI